MSPEGLLLVVNAGSSSLKFSVFGLTDGDPRELVDGEVSGFGAAPRLTARVRGEPGEFRRDLPRESVAACQDAIPVAGAWLRERFSGQPLAAVGHRVVHGGARLVKPTLLNDAVLAELEGLVPLAPLHLPPALDCIRAVRRSSGDVPQVLCFDTAFHRTHPRVAEVYALPLSLYEEGIRRYGFHGISYEYVASALPAEIARGRVIAAHLGNGASLCALDNGKSMDTTMGFSTLDGLVMGTRPGGLDAGVLLHLLGHRGMKLDEVERILYHESGLKGLSGLTHDVRTLLASPDPRAKFALDCFVRTAAKGIGAMAAALDGADALVFTAGIGENSPEIRARIVEASAWLGVKLDPAANAKHGPRISTGECRVSAWVVPTNEDLMIARHTARVLEFSSSRAAAGESPAQGASS